MQFAVDISPRVSIQYYRLYTEGDPPDFKHEVRFNPYMEGLVCVCVYKGGMGAAWGGGRGVHF